MPQYFFNLSHCDIHLLKFKFNKKYAFSSKFYSQETDAKNSNVKTALFAWIIM